MLEVKPSRELDAIVAEKIFGWQVEPQTWTYFTPPQFEVSSIHGPQAGRPLPHFSTEAAAAREVVEKLIAGGSRMDFPADSSPFAVCCGALKAIGADVIAPRHDHGREYRAKLVDASGQADHSDWFNTKAELDAMMHLVQRAHGKHYLCEERNVLCPECFYQDRDALEYPL